MTMLAKSYEPESFERKWYAYWEKEGCFHATDENAPGQESFTIVIPPPNVTGVLHMGHALTNTIQDILTRWKRMKGANALWLPGTDHAGIATQAQVEKALQKEGKNRHELGREKFLERTWKWKEDHGREITNQLRRLGSSLDWERERFTLDEGLSRAVREVFVRLFEEGLIYRGARIINWCPRCRTALSDLEVIPTERKGKLFHLRYEIVNADGSALPHHPMLTIATTRPETLLGDTAVALHPEDERYLKFHGKKAKLPLVGRVLPLILDAYVDREFGTGALKITPAHDFNDYELGKKHGLAAIDVMGKDGRITENGGAYAGLKFNDAREKIVADLEAAGLLEKTEDHLHKVGLCQRCEQVAEPLISPQWFVKIAPLAKPAIEAVETGKIEFRPKNWEKTYYEWMYNIRDWCISRQLWWGHQIPAWHCRNCEHITVSRETPKACAGCKSTEIRQDEDVLDTWFSSALWPFSTLGWPEKTKALKTFYPTSILETGFDILFFWVARMIMMGIHFMGEVPFRRVYLHAMVRDEKGEKMSKSKGNVIDPLALIDVHGADPLRFTLAVMAGQGRDVKLSTDRVTGYRAFANKVWNAVKFFHLHVAEVPGWESKHSWEPEALAREIAGFAKNPSFGASERWILARVESLVEKVDSGLEGFHLNEASQGLYDFIWGDYCDWFIELSKVSKTRENALVSLYVLDRTLRLLHPFMPFVTEELWQSLPIQHEKGKPGTLMLQKFPAPRAEFRDRASLDAEAGMEFVKRVVEAIRNFKGENRIPLKQEFTVFTHSTGGGGKERLLANDALLRSLSRISSFEWAEPPAGPSSKIILPEDGLEFMIRLEGVVDLSDEVVRLKKEIEKVDSDLAHVRGKLTRESFLAKAPPALVEKERQSEKDSMKKREELLSALGRLGGSLEGKS